MLSRRYSELKLKDIRSSLEDVLQNRWYLQNSQISQENTCVGISFLIKLQALKLQTSLKTVKDNGDNVTEENGE